jgi:hypothetical protein
MRKVFAFIPIFILVLPSCNVIYHQAHFEKTHKNNIVTTKETKIKNTGGNCLYKEITTEKDSLINQVTYKEVITYNCRGAYSYEVKRKTWPRANGKKVVTVSKK